MPSDQIRILVRPCSAEIPGTFALVFAACGAIVVNDHYHDTHLNTPLLLSM